MSKHTPGPWRHEVFSGTDHEVRAGGYLIAKVYSDPGTYTECNARLIAAAPELLEALKDLETIGRPAGDVSEDESYDLGERYGFPNGPWSEITDAVRVRARAIIAKAEGAL